MTTFGDPVSIPPGGILRLLERLGVSSFRDAAAVTFAEYLANRSVALLSRERGGLYVSSGVCVQIGDRHLIATAKHNLQDEDERDLRISALEVRPRGEKYAQPLGVRAMGLSPDFDLAWLEVTPEVAERPRLVFVKLDEIALLQEEKDQQACFLLGYPAQVAEKPSCAQEDPLLGSAALGTLSIAPSRRQGRLRLETFAIEWPPHDRSLNNELPELQGVSGGGVWLLPRHDEYQVWAPERAKLVGIETSWNREHGELIVAHIEPWLKLVADQIPELSSSTPMRLGVRKPESPF